MNLRFRRAIFLFLAPVFTLASGASASPYLSNMGGLVQVRTSGYQNWDVVKETPRGLAAGDSVRTGSKSQATIVFDDGSRIELAANGSFTLDRAEAKNSGIHLTFGRLRAFVQKLASRQFTVRTPTAVCSVRGTEFQVEVRQGGQTSVELYKGLLGVADQRGQQVLLRPNERLEIGGGGLGIPGPIPTRAQAQQSQFKSVMRREMSLDMSKEEVQAAAAREIKLAEFQQGKVMIDVFGQRVRLEEYIIRPRADQFKLVVLNERPNRFDYFYYLGTFNIALPSDIRIALRQLPGSVGAPPEYFLTSYETGRSNTQDSIVELAQGGHYVDMNSNGIPADAITTYFNTSTNRYEDVTGQAVYQTLFDNYGFYINGGLKYGWTGNSITSYRAGGGLVASVNTDPITGAALATALPGRTVSTTFPDPGDVHQTIYESYTDGTSTQWDNYIITDDGAVAKVAEFINLNSPTTYRQKILQFNFEQVITATEFKGRKIDLVVEPKILVESGLIQ